MSKPLAATLVATAVALVALAWVAWIVVEPRYWFENAYAEQGPRGDKGPRGDRGPVGPSGPVGPDAEDAVSDLDFRLTELEDATSSSDLQSQIDNLQSGVDELQSVIDELCSAVNLNYIYSSNSAIEELLTDLNDACP